jgi:hypothetical protein
MAMAMPRTYTPLLQLGYLSEALMLKTPTVERVFTGHELENNHTSPPASAILDSSEEPWLIQQLD